LDIAVQHVIINMPTKEIHTMAFYQIKEMFRTLFTVLFNGPAETKAYIFETIENQKLQK
jgi:hypothetical protein